MVDGRLRPKQERCGELVAPVREDAEGERCAAACDTGTQRRPVRSGVRTPAGRAQQPAQGQGERHGETEPDDEQADDDQPRVRASQTTSQPAAATASEVSGRSLRWRP